MQEGKHWSLHLTFQLLFIFLTNIAGEPSVKSNPLISSSNSSTEIKD